MAEARRFMELGVAGPLAEEMARQLNNSSGNARRLQELGMVAALAFRVASKANGGAVTGPQLVELGMVPQVAIEVVSGGGGIPSYVGAVGSRTRIGEAQSTTNKQNMSRTYDFLTDNITQIKFLWANRWVTGTSESNTGGNMTMAASIQRATAMGVRTQVLFGGVAQGVAAQGNILESDWMPFTASAGEKIFIDQWYSNPGSLVFQYACDQTNGEMTTSGVTVTDSTMADWSGGGGGSVRPLAVLGMTNKRSVVLFGDSRSCAAGATANVVVQGPAVGEVVGGLNNQVGLIHCGKFGDRIFDGVLVSSAVRIQMCAYVTDAILEIGGADILNALRTPAQTQTATASFITLMKSINPNIRVWLTTKSPKTTSTDGWTTLVNQTPDVSSQNLSDFNDLVRTQFGAMGAYGYFEIADTVESSRNSQKWRVLSGPAATTVDGTHENAAGYALTNPAVPPATVLA